MRIYILIHIYLRLLSSRSRGSYIFIYAYIYIHMFDKYIYLTPYDRIIKSALIQVQIYIFDPLWPNNALLSLLYIYHIYIYTWYIYMFDKYIYSTPYDWIIKSALIQVQIYILDPLWPNHQKRINTGANIHIWPPMIE